MFVFKFEIENTETHISVSAHTYREAMNKINSAQIPGLNLAELIMVELVEIEQFRFEIGSE